jgi:hypothetical protein
MIPGHFGAEDSPMRRTLFVILAVTSPLCAQAQTAAATTAGQPAEIGRRSLELRGLEDGARASDAERRKMEAEVEVIRADRARLAAALIETARKV